MTREELIEGILEDVKIRSAKEIQAGRMGRLSHQPPAWEITKYPEEYTKIATRGYAQTRALEKAKSLESLNQRRFREGLLVARKKKMAQNFRQMRTGPTDQYGDVPLKLIKRDDHLEKKIQKARKIRRIPGK